MKSNYKQLGTYIRPIDERNKNKKINKLLGVSITKSFIPSIANIVGTDLSTYKIVRTGQFAYGPVTSRNGDKISIALLKEDDCIISSSYSVFEVANTKELDPEYLMLWFSRPEFDRYSRYRSHGSVREIFDWEELCLVELPVPSIDKQREIVHAYQVINDRIALKRKINDNLLQQAIAIFDNAQQQAKFISYADLGSLADVKGGKRLPKGINLITSPNSHPYIRVRDLNDVVFASLSADYEYVDNETQKLISRYITSVGDVLISIVGTIGLTAIVDKSLDNANLTENCVKVTNLKNITPEYLLLYLRSSAGIGAITKGTVGAVQLKLPIKNIQAIQIPLLPEPELAALNETLVPLFKQIAINVSESKKLAEARDALLPKLISGELDVSDIDI